MASPHEITALLRDSGSDRGAAERLYALVYDELRGVARNQLRAERADHTLQPTALANEVYLKLLGQEEVEWHNRAQFFAIASRAMRHILVDHARSRLRQKRGGGAEHVPLHDVTHVAAPMDDEQLVSLDDALSRLKREDPVKADVVEMRFFAGLTNEEVAGVLQVTTRTVERHWRFAKAWLYRDMGEEDA